MGNVKNKFEACSAVKELSELSGVEITSKPSFADFFNSCIEKTKLSIEKAHINTVIKLIEFLEQETEPLSEWEKEMLAVLYKRRSVSLCC